MTLAGTFTNVIIRDVQIAQGSVGRKLYFIKVTSPSSTSVSLNNWSISASTFDNQFSLLLFDSVAQTNDLTVGNLVLNESTTLSESLPFKILGNIANTFMIDGVTMQNSQVTNPTGYAYFFNLQNNCGNLMVKNILLDSIPA